MKWKKEIPSITNSATTATFNTKIIEDKSKVPNITNLANTTALTVVEHKTPNVSNSVKKLTIKQKYVKLKMKLWSWSWQLYYYSRI